MLRVFLEEILISTDELKVIGFLGNLSIIFKFFNLTELRSTEVNFDFLLFLFQ